MQAAITEQAAPVRLRHEYKHTISPGDDLIVSQRLRRLFPRDPHAGPEGSYRVSSLYFDTPSDKALRQKIDGVNDREKFRIRYYNGDLSFIRLEKKFKRGGLCGKRSARLTAEQTARILAGDIGFLLESGDPLLQELYSKMKGQLLAPKTVVAYDREAFRFGPGNVRVTIDRNLRTAPAANGFLDPRRPHIPVHDGRSVLEVKYDEFLPDLVRAAVQIPNRRTGAYSKYAVCRRYD